MCRTRLQSDYLAERYVTIVSTYWTCHGSVVNTVDIYNGPEVIVHERNGPSLRQGMRLMRLWLKPRLDERSIRTAHERLVKHARTCAQGAPCSHLEHDRDVLYRDREGVLGGEPIVPQLSPTPQA
jgi:hypothetical protein